LASSRSKNIQKKLLQCINQGVQSIKRFRMTDLLTSLSIILVRDLCNAKASGHLFCNAESTEEQISGYARTVYRNGSLNYNRFGNLRGIGTVVRFVLAYISCIASNNRITGEGTP
jgi:hypothetical protein